jgi:hypothetical protein
MPGAWRRKQKEKERQRGIWSWKSLSEDGSQKRIQTAIYHKLGLNQIEGRFFLKK